MTIGFTWHANPASSEMESLISDWLVQLFGLPEKFLIKNPGGGMLGWTIGDDLFYSVLVAKYKKFKELKVTYKDTEVSKKLVGYYTKHCHLQIFKALYLKDISNIRELPLEFDEKSGNYKLRSDYTDIIEEDVKNGLIPFYFGTTIGTTSSGANDDVEEISKICQKYKIFLTVDCAWAGSYFCLDEYKHLSKSLQNANCVCINLAKCFTTGTGCASFFIDDKRLLMETMAGKGSENAPPSEYLRNQYSENQDIIDYRDWQIGLGRPFNSLKVWFVIRGYGVEGMQNLMNQSIKQASFFSEDIVKDERFALHCKQSLGLICFKLVKYYDGTNIPNDKLNALNKKYLDIVNMTGDVFLCGSEVNGDYFLRASFSPSVESRMTNVSFLLKTLKDCTIMMQK